MMRAPFPYFGGKSAVAEIVWRILGQPAHYIEPFFGSGAVLLARPGCDFKKHTETVCDKDGFIANVWRSIKFHPDETAEWCDWPVNHADLMARRAELIKNESRLLDNLVNDPMWCDPVLAGYWIWAASCWIGSGLTCKTAIPELVKSKGVYKKSWQIPHLAYKGRGIHKKSYQNKIYFVLNQLSERLRHVRVVCGDWTRICGGNWQDNIGSVGIFFDPTYGIKANRTKNIYSQDSLSVADDVRDWCLSRGDMPSYKIILAGYFEEHKSLLDNGWTFKKWKAKGGYTAGKETQSGKNRLKETLFLSPHCSKFEQMKLF